MKRLKNEKYRIPPNRTGELMNEIEGIQIVGYWISGCNGASFNYAIEDLSYSKEAFRQKKAFISTGDSDKLIFDKYRDYVEDSVNKAGLKMRSETLVGGHKISPPPHLGEALDWFLK